MKYFILVLICSLYINLYCESLFLMTELDLTQTEQQSDNEDPFYLSKNPTLAGFLSAFIPGAGQVYNEKYIKAAGIIAVQGYLVAKTVHADKKTKEYKIKRDTSEDPAERHYNNILYVDYYDSRQSFIFWVGASVLLSAMEAYVDAHLINFKQMKNEVRLRFDDQKLQVSITF